MLSVRASIRPQRCPILYHYSKYTYITTAYSAKAPHSLRITDEDVNAARSYCSDLLQKFDSSSYTLQTFIPQSSRDAYLSIRALNIELARIADVVSNPTIGALRTQFWRDNLTRTFADTPPKEPVAILLHHALSSLRAQHTVISTSVMKGWFMRVINAREQYMDNRPYTSLETLETYAENTYSTLMYLTLAALPLHSMAADHVASHIGESDRNNAAFGGTQGGSAGSRHGIVLLPLEVMADAGVKEEEVLRQGAEAPGLKDAVFTVATRANDHLITAREMLKSLQQGKGAGHAFEHEGEEGHQYSQASSKGNTEADDLERAFGVLMPAVATSLWLEKLEKYDFDVFRPELRAREWKLPWKAYWAYSQRKI